MVLGKQGGCLPYIIAVVATLSVRDPQLRDTSNLDNHRETEGNELEQEKADIEVGKLQGKNEEGNLTSIMEEYKAIYISFRHLSVFTNIFYIYAI